MRWLTLYFSSMYQGKCFGSILIQLLTQRICLDSKLCIFWESSLPWSIVIRYLNWEQCGPVWILWFIRRFLCCFPLDPCVDHQDSWEKVQKKARLGFKLQAYDCTVLENNQMEGCNVCKGLIKGRKGLPIVSSLSLMPCQYSRCEFGDAA